MECLDYALLLSGVGETEQPVLEALCRAAEVELAGSLRDGVAVEDCGEAFPLAAAWMALAGLYGGRGTEEPTSWSAGPVSVSGGRSAGEQAGELRKLAEGLMRPYVKDAEFCFREVRG